MTRQYREREDALKEQVKKTGDKLMELEAKCLLLEEELEERNKIDRTHRSIQAS